MVLDFNNLNAAQVKQLNQIYLARQSIFNDLIEKLLKSTNQEIEWLVSIVASRHAHQSKLYHDIVKLELANELNASNNISKIIFPSKILRDIFLVENPHSLIKVDYFIKNRAVVNKIFKDLMNAIIISSQLILSKDKKRKEELINKNILLIETFILPNSISAGKYLDRYYNGILNFLNEKEKSKLFFLPKIMGRYSQRSLKRMSLSSQENFLFMQDFLKLKDYLRAFVRLVKIKFPKNKKFLFIESDITKLIKHEFNRTKYSPSSYQGILNYLFIKRLKGHNVKLDLLIDWNENQPIDKGLIKGVRDYYPNTYIKGYQGYIISADFNFYIQPADYEIFNGVIPDEICVIGDGLKSAVKTFSKKIKVTTAPAFRFKNVYQNFERKEFDKRLMVALTIDQKESFDILSLIGLAIKMVKVEIKILIKPHPVLNMDKLTNKLGGLWMPEFNIVYGDFNSIVSNVDMLIGSASSTLVEAISRGIPVIVIGSQNGITQNPIPKSVSQEIWRLVNTPDELAESVNYYANITDLEREKFMVLGAEIKKNYFEPVTAEAVRAFLN